MSVAARPICNTPLIHCSTPLLAPRHGMGNSLRNQQHVRPVKQRLSRRERRICFRFLPACCGFVARKIKNLNNNSTHRHFFTMELGKDNLVHDIWRVSIVAVVLVSVFSTFNRSIKCYLPPNRSVSNENVSLFILNSKVLCSLLPHVLRAFWSNIVWVIFKDNMVMYPDCSLNWPSMTALNMGIMVWWWTLRRSLRISPKYLAKLFARAKAKARVSPESSLLSPDRF